MENAGITNINQPSAEPTTSDFRLFLQGELLRRCKTNPRYSIRSFAKLLKIDPSTLSQILRGKRALTHAVVLKLGTKLGLSPIELSKYLEAAPTRRKSANEEKSPLQQAQELTLDAFQIISDWYHYAIFELVT